MLYFSEIRFKKIKTEDGISIGFLEDFIFLTSDNPIVTKLVIRNPLSQKQIVSTDYIQKINSDIILAKEYLTSYLEENELFLVKNLLDKQIIDIKGDKIVRVNDVLLQDKEKLSIAGVDVGLLGIMRRLRLGGNGIYRMLQYFGIKMTSNFLSWADVQPLELIRGQVRLKKRENKLQKIRPEDLADYLEQTNVINARKFLKILSTEKAADVISNLNINYQTALFKYFKNDTAARFISFIDPDEAVDVLLTLSKKKRLEILNHLDEKTRLPLLKLLELSKNPIGKLITTEYVAVDSVDTVSEVFEKIKRNSADFSSLDYVFVVNKKNELVGVFSLHELILQNTDAPVYKFMIQNVVVIHMTTPIEIVIKKMLKYKIDAIPVINEEKRIEGIVTFDDVSNILLNKIKY